MVKTLKKSDQVFKIPSKPASLNKIKTYIDFKEYAEDIKEQYYTYIENEFNHRSNGYWFMCNNEFLELHYRIALYIPQLGRKIDVGAPDFRQANRIFYYFWEACKADKKILRNVLP